MTLQEYNDLYKLPILKSMTITSSGGVTITNTNIVSEKMSLEIKKYRVVQLRTTLFLPLKEINSFNSLRSRIFKLFFD